MTVQLVATRLAAMANHRESGRVRWTNDGKVFFLDFVDGRPIRAVGASGQANVDRAVVARTLRAFALADASQAVVEALPSSGPDLGIDTLGELLVELARGLQPNVVSAIAAENAGAAPTPLFDRLSGPIAQLAGAAPQRVVSSDKATVIAIILGGFTPKLSPMVEEIVKAHDAMAGQDHYAFLAVDKSADADTIRKAYFVHAKRWHTDRFAGVDLGPHRVMVEALFRRADEAQKTLSDPEQRSNYDVTLERAAKGLPTDVSEVFEAEGLLRKAQMFVRRGQAAAAEPLLAQAIKVNPDEAEAYAYYGYAIFAAKGVSAIEEARAQIKIALDKDAKLDVAHEFLGKMARVAGNNAQAISSLKKAIELNPKNREAERELRFITTQQAKNKEKEPGGGLLGKLLKR